MNRIITAVLAAAVIASFSPEPVLAATSPAAVEDIDDLQNINSDALSAVAAGNPGDALLAVGFTAARQAARG